MTDTDNVVRNSFAAKFRMAKKQCVEFTFSEI